MYFLRPIALLIVAVGLKVLFERAIDSFDLTVCRGVMAGREVKSHGKERSERVEKVGREAFSTLTGWIRGVPDMSRQATLAFSITWS